MGGERTRQTSSLLFLSKKGEAGIFYEQLKRLHEFVKQEWIEQGNLAADFNRDQRLLYF
jgi:hypothetical protein